MLDDSFRVCSIKNYTADQAHFEIYISISNIIAYRGWWSAISSIPLILGIIWKAVIPKRWYQTSAIYESRIEETNC